MTAEQIDLVRLARGADRPWLVRSDGPRFAVWLGEERIDSTALERREAHGDWTRLVDERRGLDVVHRELVHPEGVIESSFTLRNTGDAPLHVTRLDSVSLELAPAAYELLSFTGEWGEEFEPAREPVRGRTVVETRSGRASHGHHPWCTLARDDGALLTVAVRWSGNWAIRLEPEDGGTLRLSGGLHDWKFFRDLAPGEVLEAVPVVLALGEAGDLDTTSIPLARVGRRAWYPSNEIVRALPAEWNHWWPYEDKEIDEATFLANVDVAARLGVGVCTLDAGWFGPTDPGSHWYDYRGDWHRVNTVRFPRGIRALSDAVHERGMRFGLWCEIEALGERAELAEQHPELGADTRHPPRAHPEGDPFDHARRLGYVCFGSPAVREWAFATLDRLIRDYRCDWIKLDFNLDPGPGCNRIDHGHGAGDGLYAHVRGYYAVLERVRAAHPEVVLENCSSGGLRVDLGLAGRTHCAFLSDPDWPEHSLQLFWGASTMLAPERCLHWGYCEWRTRHPRQRYDPRDPSLRPHQVDYYARTGMLGAFGLSLRLPDLPAWVADRYREHVRVQRDVVRPFVRDGDVYRLTGQPRRGGRGDRWAGFQYRLPDGSQHLVFAFRLPGGEPARSLRLRGLEAEREYLVSSAGPDERPALRLAGRELVESGLRLDDLPEEGSALLLVR